jgi:hypothetical protein
MTPKEKAEELVHKFAIGYHDLVQCKQSAIICVDEIIKVLYKDRMMEGEWLLEVEADNYWKEVKEEIQKL